MFESKTSFWEINRVRIQYNLICKNDTMNPSVTLVLKLEYTWELWVQAKYRCLASTTDLKSPRMRIGYLHFLKTSTGVSNADSCLRVTGTKSRNKLGVEPLIWGHLKIGWGIGASYHNNLEVKTPFCTQDQDCYEPCNAWSIPQNEELTHPKCHWNHCWKTMDYMCSEFFLETENRYWIKLQSIRGHMKNQIPFPVSLTLTLLRILGIKNM